MTNATTIRIALKAESENLAHDGHFGASEALISFARQATPEELIRFRELILSVTDADLEVANAD